MQGDPSGQLFKGLVGVIAIDVGGYMVLKGMVFAGALVATVGTALVIWDAYEYIHKPPGKEALRRHGGELDKAMDDYPCGD
jgi:hypothetical protein